MNVLLSAGVSRSPSSRVRAWRARPPQPRGSGLDRCHLLFIRAREHRESAPRGAAAARTRELRLGTAGVRTRTLFLEWCARAAFPDPSRSRRASRPLRGSTRKRDVTSPYRPAEPPHDRDRSAGTLPEHSPPARRHDCVQGGQRVLETPPGFRGHGGPEPAEREGVRGAAEPRAGSPLPEGDPDQAHLLPQLQRLHLGARGLPVRR